MREMGRRIGWLAAAALTPWLDAGCGGRATDLTSTTGGEPGGELAGSGSSSESGGTSGRNPQATGGVGTCVVGNERCDCYPNGTCNGTLRCLSDLCVAGGDATGGGAGSGTSGIGGATGGTGGATGGSCTIGNERCACYPNNACNGTLRCLSDLCVAYRPPTGGNGGAAGNETSGTLAGSAGVGATSAGGAGGTSGGAAGGPSNHPLPCDVLADAHVPCVAAHSTVRMLVSGYAGPLYQVCRGSRQPGPGSCQGESLDIGAVDGRADVAAQDIFCSSAACSITIVYDQSPMGNHLEPAPPGGAKPTPGNPVNATDLAITIDGHPAYGMLFRPGMGYRKLIGIGTAIDDEPQTIYMVTSQHDLIDGCCFDYGNAETSANADGNGAVEAVYFGAGVIWGSGVGGEGPWVMADLENGLYAGWENGQDQAISTNTPLPYDFVTAILVGDTADKNGGRGRFALYGADATSGELTTMYDGIRPEKPGYVPMRKQGSVILGIAGDNSDGDGGRFYEGVMANGAAAAATLDALQASIVAAGYGR